MYMLHKIILAGICTLFLLSMAQGATIYVSGDVWGQWSADTVIVTDSIRVPADSMLMIDPGTIVLFMTYDKFIVDAGATLLAVGTEADTILFDEFYTGNRWHGIHFLFASESSRLEYCHLTHGWASGDGDDISGGAILCENTSLTIMNCLIDSCAAEASGGAIVGLNSENVTIDSCTIINNRAETNIGGGVCYYNCSSVISNSNISDNFSHNSGGGIISLLSDVEITNNDILNNTSGLNGSGICVAVNSDVIITANNISQNHSEFTNLTQHFRGIGISVSKSHAIISNNTIADNLGPTGWRSYGAGIQTDSSNGEIINNTIIANGARGIDGYGGGIYCENLLTPNIIGNTIRDNWAAENGGGIKLTNAHPDSIAGNNLINNWARDVGGGIYCDGSTTFISNNFIDSNKTDQYGAGIACSYSSSDIVGNIITNNKATQFNGGGITCYYSNANIKYNTIAFNEAGGNGGGIHCFEHHTAISCNVITENTAGLSGGGMGLASSDSRVMNNTISYNTANQNGGGLYCDLSSPTVVNTISYFNNATSGPDLWLINSSDPDITYSCIGGYATVEGNINTDPIFRDPGNGDFYLMATACGDAEDSPCIDAGHPEIYDDTIHCDWGLGTSRSDMGGYGGINQVPQVLNIPDYTIDQGLTFSPIMLDNYVDDPSHSDDEIDWSVINTEYVSISIIDRVAEISVIDTCWIGSDTVIFIATDPGGLSDSDTAIFTVLSAMQVADIPDQEIYQNETFASIILDNYVDDFCHSDDVIVWSFSESDTDYVSLTITDRIAEISHSGDWDGSDTVNFTATNPDGYSVSDTVVFTVLPGNGIGDPTPGNLPFVYSLDQNYPNPFNPVTKIGYRLSKKSRVTIDIYNIVGRKIRTLLDEIKAAGEYQITWDAKDFNGQGVATGIYLYHFRADDYVETRKMVFLK